MASASFRMHQKLSDGTYQAIHAETESGVVLRPNGDTVEKTLRQCVLAEDAGGNVPGFIVDADTLDGSTKEEIIASAQAGVDLSSYATKKELSSHTGNTSNPHGVTKAQVGLGNVDNTADAQKSVNYANSAGSANTASTATGMANSNPGTASLKNIYAGTADIGAGAGLATGTIYLVYE